MDSAFLFVQLEQRGGEVTAAGIRQGDLIAQPTAQA